MENFRELKKLHISDNAESEDDAWSWPGVIRVLPKDAEEKCHTPDVKRVVVVTPDDTASSLVQYLEGRYPEVPEWTVETALDRKESEEMVVESAERKRPWWKRLFCCWKT
ncbi:uncharacterized protein LOC111627535 [Centruroides sculpturatus]|uniref:uncharacterized protein LOC111627535 n=1 Tax=Centruroides sculpturatus TaxID=218467 RepID=UPI000C6E36B4|nr:uncharacterized protein LOC111627535 [Centruroides sculpturatus]